MATHDALVLGVILGAVAATLSLALLPYLAQALHLLGAGKEIRPEGPASHQVKAGTPSMGGLVFVGVVAALGLPVFGQHDVTVVVLLPIFLAAMALGLIDDLLGSARFKRGGLRARPKLAWQAAIAMGAVALQATGPGLPAQHIPGLGEVGDVWLVAPLAVLAIVAAGHAVNLTDGLDGLAAGTCIIALAAFAIIAFAQGQGSIGALCLLTIGAVGGFLWYNIHPARLFMGDAGSLALGSLLGGLAMATGQIVVLLPIGVVFMAETLSVILQVAYFKRTGGKRIFKMAPLHHHFEQVGWQETQIVQRFWLVGLAGALIGLALAL
jgi:phospho-N-acetylmuramoyl-pentapeptide-transferase